MDEQALTFDSFSNYEPYIGVNRRFVRRVDDTSRINGKDILEIGVGTGLIPKLCFEVGQPRKIVGIDPDLQALEIAEHELSPYPNVELRRMKAQDITYSQDFDIVFFLNSIHLLSSSDMDKALSAIYRSLRPGGVIGINTTFHREFPVIGTDGFWTKWVREAVRLFPERKSYNQDPQTAIEFLPKAEYIRKVETNGFEVNSVSESDICINKEGLQGIARYGRFVRGTFKLPDNPEAVQKGSDALYAAVDRALVDTTFPYRHWLEILAVKPTRRSDPI